MNKRSASIVWAIVALVLLLSIGKPVQLVTMSFMAIPFVMLFTTLSIRSFVLYVVALLAVAFFLGGSIGSVIVLVSLYFIIPGIVMGLMHKRKRSGWHVFISGSIAFLAESLLLLAVGILVLNFDLTEFIRSQLTVSMEPLVEAAAITTSAAEDMIHSLTSMFNQMIPLMLIMSSLYMGTVTYAISRRLLTAQGVEVRKMPPVKSWRLPRSLIWYYLITLILLMIFRTSTDSFMNVILVNLIPIVDLALIVQGISFLYFWADHKKWPKFMPVLFIIAALFVPFVSEIFKFAGIFDIAFPLRQMVTRPKQ